MDGAYEVWSLDFRLKKICAVRVIHQFLEESRVAAGQLLQEDILRNFVLLRISQLNLNEDVKSGIRKLVHPVISDFHRYYSEIGGLPHKPTLTPQGVVNKKQTINALLDNGNIHHNFRFEIACNFCHTDQMVSLARNVNFGQIYDRTKVNSLLKFWCKTIYCDGSGFCFPEKISVDCFEEGLTAAIEGCWDLAVKYFIRLPCKDLLRLVLKGDLMEKFLSNVIILPNTYSLVFSILGKDERQNEQFNRAYRLLIGLLEWPYQPYFLKAAEVLVRSDQQLFPAMVPRIIEAINADRNDYDYLELFVLFWKAFPHSFAKSIVRDSNYLQTVFDAFLTKQLVIIGLVISEIAVMQRGVIMKQFGESQQCEKLFIAMEYDTIKDILRAFMNKKPDIKILERFIYAFRARCFQNPLGLWSRDHTPPLTNVERLAASCAIDKMFVELKLEINQGLL